MSEARDDPRHTTTPTRDPVFQVQAVPDGPLDTTVPMGCPEPVSGTQPATGPTNDRPEVLPPGVPGSDLRRRSGDGERECGLEDIGIGQRLYEWRRKRGGGGGDASVERRGDLLAERRLTGGGGDPTPPPTPSWLGHAKGGTVITASQGTQTWLAAREGCVTCSKLAGLAGNSEWESPYMALGRLRGDIPPPSETPAMRWGSDMESVALTAWLQTQTYEEVEHFGLVRSNRTPWLYGSPDAIVTIRGEKVLVEVKCPYRNARKRGPDQWGEPVHGPPDDHYDQMQGLMHVMGLARGIYVRWWPGTVRWCHVEYDESYVMGQLLPAVVRTIMCDE